MTLTLELPRKVTDITSHAGYRFWTRAKDPPQTKMVWSLIPGDVLNGKVVGPVQYRHGDEGYVAEYRIRGNWATYVCQAPYVDGHLLNKVKVVTTLAHG